MQHNTCFLQGDSADETYTHVVEYSVNIARQWFTDDDGVQTLRMGAAQGSYFHSDATSSTTATTAGSETTAGSSLSDMHEAENLTPSRYGLRARIVK